MPDIAALQISIEANTKDAEEGLNKVNRSLFDLGGIIPGVGGALASFAGTALTGVVAGAGLVVGALGVQGVAGAMSGIAENAVGLNSSLEQSRLTFATLLGGAEKADAFLRDLAKFAAETPFEFGGLVESAKNLLAYGFSVEQTIPLLTDLGNTAAALGTDKLPQLTRALGQMMTQGVVQKGELNQLAEAGVNLGEVFQVLAQRTGKSVADLKVDLENGKIPAQEFVAAFQEWSQLRFGDMMAAQSKTFAGAMSTIQDSVSMAVATAFKPFFNLLSEGAIALAGFVQSATFQSWAQGVAKMFEDLIKAARPFFDVFLLELPILRDIAVQVFQNALLPAFQAVMTLVSQLAGVFGVSLGGSKDALGTFIAGLNGFNATLTAVINGIVDFVRGVWPTISGAIINGALFIRDQAIPAIQGFAKGVQDALAVPIGWVQANWPVIVQTIQSVMSGIAGVVQPVLAGLVSWWEQNGGLILAAVSAAWSAISQTIGAVISTIGPTIQAVMLALQGDWKNAWNQIQATAIDFNAKMGPIISQWIDTFKSWWSIVAPRLAEFAGNLLNWAGQQVGPILAKLQEWGQLFGNWVQGVAWPWLQQELGKLANNLLNWAVAQVPPLLEKLKEWGAAFGAWVEKGWAILQPKLIELGKSLVNWIVAQLPHLSEQLKAWGDAFLDWLDAGGAGGKLDPRLQVVVDSITDFIGAATPKIAKKLGDWATAFAGEAGGWLLGTALPKLLKALGQFLLDMGTWIAFEAAPRINQKMFELGAAMVGGILGGIGDLKDKLFAKLQEGIFGAITRTRSWLRIASPSQYFHDAIGLPIGEGIVQGVIAGLAGLVEGVKGILGQLTGLAGGILGGIGDVLGGAIGSAASVVFKPVANLISTDINAQIAAWGMAVRDAIRIQTKDLTGNINANTGTVNGYLSDILGALKPKPGQPGELGFAGTINISVEEESYIEKIVAVLASVGLSRATA